MDRQREEEYSNPTKIFARFLVCNSWCTTLLLTRCRSQNRFYSDNTDEEKQALLAASRQQLSLVENDLDVHEEIIAEREKGIEEIQGAMLEVNEMFRDLNTIVLEQAPLVGS